MRFLPSFLTMLLLLSCSDELAVTIPAIDTASELAGTVALPAEALDALEGVYEVVDGQPLLGREAVVKRTGKGISIFTEIGRAHV